MKYVRKLINDYCVLDLETTGFSPKYDDVIEIAILRVRNNEIVDTYHSLTRPSCEVNSFITSLTGIKSSMLEGRPMFCVLKNEVMEFIGNDVILGHRTSFDISFLQNKFDEEYENEYIDTYQLARKLFPDFRCHALEYLCEQLDFESSHHRASSDCEATKFIYDTIKSKLKSEQKTLEDLYKKVRKSYKSRYNLNSIVATSEDIDEDGFFYGKHCVFTGALEKMVRKDAMQLVVNVGGVLDKSVTKSTNYLILGNNDYCKSIKDGKSSKQKKAEELRLKGQDITIVDETMFYELLKIK